MLISPPFLPARGATDTEDTWINRCMAGGLPGQGAFPVSFNLGWHGGMHLTAPANGNQWEPVRAIADGEVVFVRQPTPMPAGELPPDHPQAYGGSWTDNGVVVIRHRTEIGEGADATVTFFSITMHLNQIDPAIRQGRAVYRKAALGVAGRIAGRSLGEAFLHTIHLEIVCDQTQVARLAGRASGELSTAADGRTDVVFGELYFHVPAGAQVYAQQPLPNYAQAMMQPPAPRGQPAPAPQPLQPVYTTAEALLVGLRYAGGEGSVGNRGDADLTTYRLDGSTLGAALTEDNAEYNLYTAATSISDAYPAAARPAPSAVFELLRFGRVIGPDALAPADVPHWRQVRYPGGQGWLNLNAANVHKFSDADFPHWKHWSFVDDGADGNSRCDSAVIRGWLDSDGNGVVTTAEAQSRLADRTVAPKLAHAICKFPTEWNAATIDARWGWLKIQSDENPVPLNDEDFEALRRHITALTFWPGGMGIDANHWHWQPREFIKHFRLCSWMSLDETLTCLPVGHGVLAFENMRTRFTQGISTQRQIFPAGMYAAMNKARAKYSIIGALRTAHFFGQVCVETDRLQTVREYASGNAYDMSVDPAKAAELGNSQPGDGPRFKGRGAIQLTGRANYRAYGDYRDQNYTTDPNNLILQDDAYTAVDASAHYWTAEKTRDRHLNPPNSRRRYRWILDGFININKRSDSRTFDSLQQVTQVDADVLNVTLQVNRAALHIDERRAFFKAAYFSLSEQLIPVGGIANLRP